MKAIIYTNQEEASNALAKCSSDIPQGELDQKGTGLFSAMVTNKPYTWIVNHPTESKWALVADEKVEATLGSQAVELDETWFPETASILFDLGNK